MKYRVIKVHDYTGVPYYVPQYKKFLIWRDCIEYSVILGRDYGVSFMEKDDAVKYVKTKKENDLRDKKCEKKTVVYTDSADVGTEEVVDRRVHKEL